MSEKKEFKLRIPLSSTLPACIAMDDNIPDSVKIYWSQVYGLCSSRGYCWATDEQLSEMKGVSVKTIERWNLILTKNGHIVRKTKNIRTNQDELNEKPKWTKKRKIYCIIKQPQIPDDEEDELDDSKKDFEPLTNEGSLEPLTNEGYKEECLSSNSQEESEFSSFVYTPPEKKEERPYPDCLNLLDIDFPSKKQITEAHSDEKIERAVKRTLKWTNRINDQSAIFAVLKHFDTWYDIPTIEDKKEESLKFLESLEHLDETYIGLTRIVIGNKYIEFICGPKTIVFDLEDPEFKKKTVEYLEFLRRSVS